MVFKIRFENKKLDCNALSRWMANRVELVTALAAEILVQLISLGIAGSVPRTRETFCVLGKAGLSLDHAPLPSTDADRRWTAALLSGFPYQDRPCCL